MHGCWRVAETPEPRENIVLRYGLDFGFGSDPLAFVRCWIDGNNLYIDHEAYGHGVEIDDMAEVMASVPGAKKWPVIADSSRPESISYLNRQEYRVSPSKKGSGSVEDGISFIKGHNVIINPRCVYTIEEFRKYSYKKDKNGKILPIIIDAWNHCIDGVRYALEGEIRQNTLISEELARQAAAQERKMEEFYSSPVVIGVYTKRFVTDKNVITVRQGLKVHLQEVIGTVSVTELSSMIATYISDYRAQMVFIDNGGTEPAAVSVINRLYELGHRKVIGVNLSNQAGDIKRYYNKYAEIWSEMKEWLEMGDIPADDYLINDLSGPLRGYDGKQRLQMEKMEDTHKRLMYYPAQATSLALTFTQTIVEQVSRRDLMPEATAYY
jgi:hypothetical protein